MMFHTFVISAYQESRYLESCIKSLKAQTVPSEIICTTSTPSPYLTKLMEKYQIPLYVREGRSDIQEDWNFAISKASGEFVTVAHQDDMYNRHYTEELMKQFNQQFQLYLDGDTASAEDMLAATQAQWETAFQ